MCPRKREKYASREDAILQALEVEKQLLHNKYPTPVPLNCNPPDASQLRKEPGPNNQVNRRSTRVIRVPARLMEYDNDLSPHDTIQRKRPRHDDHNQPTPKLPNPMPLQLLLAGMAAAASNDSSDHAPDHLLSEKTKPSPEDEDEDEDSETFFSGTESLGSDTYDATLSAESTGRGIDADTGNKQLVDRLQKELLNQKQRNQQMETELVAMKRERDFALSELEEMRQQLKKQKVATGKHKKECEVEYAGN